MSSDGKSWVKYDAENEFPIQNIPFGVISTAAGNHIATRVGDTVFDLHALASAGLLGDAAAVLKEDTLNSFMAAGRPVWRAVRARLQELFGAGNTELAGNAQLLATAAVAAADAVNVMPARVGDYTDFYSSREHATNIGIMFRGKDNALQPNWLHLPVGYHGRASSVVVSGTPVKRPSGQKKPPTGNPVFGACERLDIELETAFFVGPGNKLGEPIPIDKADEHMFGMVLLNDWSARDIQKWEYVPLGPFLGKSFSSTISPWVITMDALEPFRVQGPEQKDPEVLPYLQGGKPAGYDIQLAVEYKTPAMEKGDVICRSNLKYMYWSMSQQLVHHCCNGCNMRPGDLLGSGTISGPTKGSYGSLLEMTWGGKEKVALSSGEERTFMQDGDSVTLRGFCQGDGFRVGFGLCEGTIV